MRRMPAAVAALVLCIAAAAGALEWPVEQRIVTGTFGEDRGDHFHLGIDIGGGEQTVRPVLPGELVFRYEENADYTSLPRGVGSFAVIRHQDDVLSVYCHLRREPDRPARTAFTARDAVGVIGDTGYSEGKHLHFMVFDGQTGSWVNPLSLLPPVADRDPPVVKRLALRTGDRIVDLLPGISVPSGQAEVLVETYDVRGDVRFLWPLAPYAVRLALNGSEVVADRLRGAAGEGGAHGVVGHLARGPRRLRLRSPHEARHGRAARGRVAPARRGARLRGQRGLPRGLLHGPRVMPSW